MGVGGGAEAIEAFRRALEINPTFSRARSKLAVCQFEAGLKEAAMEQLSAPACLDRQTLELHYKTALLYCDRDKFASSLTNLERQMQQNFTNSADATVNILLVLQNLGLQDRAEAMWENLSYTTTQAINMNHPYSPWNS
jgi:tetratricopeptide (TPR) repeat protein